MAGWSNERSSDRLFAEVLLQRRRVVAESVADVLERRATQRNRHLGGLAFSDVEVLGENTLVAVEAVPSEPERTVDHRRVGARIISFVPRMLQPVERRAA